MELANRALALVPEQDGYVRSLIYMGLAGAYQLLDDYQNAVQAFQMLIQHGRAGGNLISELLGVSALLQMALKHGQLHFAFELASQAQERLERLGWLSPICGAVYGGTRLHLLPVVPARTGA